MINSRVLYTGADPELTGCYGTVIKVIDDSGDYYTVRWDNGSTYKHHCMNVKIVGTGIIFNAPDAVDKPVHYQFFPDLEAIEVIARSMTQEQFYGYCLGNRLKYRLRAGNKDKLEQDIAKSDKYIELYAQHKQKCLDAK